MGDMLARGRGTNARACDETALQSGGLPLTYNPARLRLICSTLSVLLLAGCGSPPPPQAEKAPEKAWRRVGAWSGRGNQQLETFVIEGWIWRVQWAARNEARPGSGSLRVAAMSADSGREIAEVTSVRGDDHDTKYLSDLPRRYYLEVSAADVDWSLLVEEPEE